MPIARYTEQLMKDLQSRGECVEYFLESKGEKGKKNAETRIRNAAFRLGVQVRTERRNGYILGTVK